MNLSHNALRDLTALTELKSVGRILERHFVLLKEHVMKGRLVSASSLDGLRMPLQLRRIGGISEKEHAADVDGKVVEILNNSGFVEVVGDSSAPSPGLPLFDLLPRGNILPLSQGLELAASQSVEASEQGSGLRQTPWAATSSTVGPKLSASR